MTTDSTILRLDYQPPAWLVPEIDMVFELGIESTDVITTLQLKRGPGPAAALRLDGEGLQLLDLRLDGR
ncbi:MAG: hypothetical protein L0H70_01790, partial [Xanthomonadales bacterium]|nr:hypothetical protein [Xanthomonadales bacterium]